jgi:ribosome maturation factor RimP
LVQGEGGLTERLSAVISPVVAGMGFRLVRVRFISGGRPRLQVMAERPDGSMTVEDCASLSQALSAVLDVEDPIHGEYALEVSSPGIDRPLTSLEDFARFAGRTLRAELRSAQNGRRRFRGVLRGIEGQDVVIEEEGGAIVRLPFASIEEAKLVLTNELIAESLRKERRARRAPDEAPESAS